MKNLTDKDSNTTIEHLKKLVKKFCEDREWDKYHSPKNLAIGIVTEASELLEIFRWKSEEDSYNLLKDPKKLEEIRHELADVFYFVLRFAQKYEIDLTNALIEKLKINEERYPIEKAKGSDKKYTEL